MASLELLITAVGGFPNLSSRLVASFVNERVMDDVGGDELIVRCFTTMPNYVTTVSAAITGNVGSATLTVIRNVWLRTYFVRLLIGLVSFQALINHAIHTIDDKMESPSGSTFLTTCFAFAKGEAAQRFQTIILARAVAMAKKRSG